MLPREWVEKSCSGRLSYESHTPLMLHPMCAECCWQRDLSCQLKFMPLWMTCGRSMSILILFQSLQCNRAAATSVPAEGTSMQEWAGRHRSGPKPLALMALSNSCCWLHVFETRNFMLLQLTLSTACSLYKSHHARPGKGFLSLPVVCDRLLEKEYGKQWVPTTWLRYLLVVVLWLPTPETAATHHV